MHKSKLNFFQIYGGPTKDCLPEGDEKFRVVSTLYKNVFYENVKIVFGFLVKYNNKVLLCKWKMQPSYGLFISNGFVHGESEKDGEDQEVYQVVEQTSNAVVG